jgi:tRNA threonylcarbamoyladenosine modification (KEOPS) complex  Pcc1 subunit
MTPSRHAEYRVPCDNAEQALRIRKALEVETRDTPARTQVTILNEAATLVVTIESDDTRGLRAATHSFLRWAQAALDVDRTVSSSPRP